MASFQAKISQEKLGKSKKKKKIVLMSSYLTRNREFQKNSKKIPKIEKKPFWLLFKPKKFRNGRKWEKIKKKSFRLVLTRLGIENYKKQQKNLKIKKHCNGVVSSQTKMGKAKKECKQKNRSDKFLPDSEQGIPKKQQKN